MSDYGPRHWAPKDRHSVDFMLDINALFNAGHIKRGGGISPTGGDQISCMPALGKVLSCALDHCRMRKKSLALAVPSSVPWACSVRADRETDALDDFNRPLYWQPPFTSDSPAHRCKPTHAESPGGGQRPGVL